MDLVGYQLVIGLDGLRPRLDWIRLVYRLLVISITITAFGNLYIIVVRDNHYRSKRVNWISYKKLL